ncbi:MAG TPA: hypothetical protein VF883_22230 [Thermoanaerobaculia bacterium]
MVLLLLIAVAPALAFAQSESPVLVELDSTGIGSFEFTNPVKVNEIGSRPLLFRNTTGDRTFVVSIPFTYPPAELASAYTLAIADRRRATLDSVVCAALDPRPGACSKDETNDLGTLEGLRILAETVAAAKAAGLKDCTRSAACDTTNDPASCPPPSADCLVETFFWSATCGLDARTLANYGRTGDSAGIVRRALERHAATMVDNLFAPNPLTWPGCTLVQATALQKSILDEIQIRPSVPRSAVEALTPAAETTGVAARFGATRIKLTKEVLSNELKARSKNTHGQLGSVFTRLDELRSKFSRTERGAATADTRAAAQCRLREVEAAAKLLVSYDGESVVPYTGIPDSLLDPAQSCTQQYGRGTTLAQVQAMVTHRASEQGIEISDCDLESSPILCSATATIPPYQSAIFSTAVLEHHPTARIRFTVSFFGETQPPPNANGFVFRNAGAADKKIRGSFGFGLGADSTTSFDPDEQLLGQRRHSAGAGTATIQFTGRFDASVTLQFKQGDFGGPASTTQVTASQYQAKVASEAGVTLQYGRMLFAKPASGIALNAFGEGAQVTWDKYRLSLAYLVNRESDHAKNIADRQNDDNDLLLFQARSIGTDWVRRGPFRGIDLTVAYGEEKRDDAATVRNDDGTVTVPPRPRPYTHWTFGPEFRFGTERAPSLAASLAVFHSIRNVRPPHTPDPIRPSVVLYDGRGTVGLARVSWTRLVRPPLTEKKQGRLPAFGLTGLIGWGSSDDASTANRDEGYLGETAGYANDVIFLSSISKAYATVIGRGLTNKTYYGVQYTDARWSPTALLAGLFGATVESQAAIVTGHLYRFNKPVHGGRSGGGEINADFQVETPKNVRWSVGTAYYFRSRAIRLAGIIDDPWAATAKVSINITGR